MAVVDSQWLIYHNPMDVLYISPFVLLPYTVILVFLPPSVPASFPSKTVRSNYGVLPKPSMPLTYTSTSSLLLPSHGPLTTVSTSKPK